MAVMARAVTVGRIVFLMALSMTLGAWYTLVEWNPEISFTVTLGFVVLAQQVISNYFESPTDDPWQIRVVLMMVVGYMVLFGTSIAVWNKIISAQLATGFLLFAVKIIKEYFFAGSLPPEADPAKTETPVVIEPKPTTTEGEHKP